MKNLLVYTREDCQFSKEVKTLVKIQIDNSLDFFSQKDIILVTNFDYEFNGVKSVVIPDLSYKPDRTNKIPAIVYLLENNLLPNDTIWYHDFDAFQDKEVNIETKLAFTKYGYKDSWNGGSFFFNNSASSKFKLWRDQIKPRTRADEKTLNYLTKSNIIKKEEYEVLGVEYNYNQRIPFYSEFDNIEPKVLHFHPYYKYYKAKENNLNIFMYGKNRLNRVLMSERLIKIFNKHGIK